MMPPSYNSRGRAQSCDEHGAILILMSILSVVFLTVVALAVDAGNLYRARIWLQKAADAGALSGVGVTVYQNEVLPTNPTDLTNFIEDRAEQVAFNNMMRAGLNVSRADIVAAYTPPGVAGAFPQLQVDVTSDIPFFLMHLVPTEIFGGVRASATRTLTADAMTQRKNANIVLVLDISSSMRCPASGSCNCLTPARRLADGSLLTCEAEAAANGTVQKNQALLSAVNNFVQRFDPQRDRISLVVFNTSAQIAVPFRAVDVSTGKAEFGFNRTNNEFQTGPGIVDTLASLANGGNTNACDGLMRAFEASQTAGLIDPSGTPKEDVAYVYFSDGAPTAGRFLFTGGALPVNDPLNYGGGSGRDYIHHTVQWVDATSSANYPGPSPFIPTGITPFSDTPPVLPALGTTAACAANPPVSQEANFEGYLSGCVSSFESHLPKETGNVYGSDYTPSKLAQQIMTGDLAIPYYRGWQEMYYACAIEMADFLRAKRGVIFTLGWGTPSANTSALQNPADGLSLKPYFMARFANDFLIAVDNPIRTGGSVFPEPVYNGYTPYTLSRASSQGDYIQGATGTTALDAMFKRVAVQILLRLVS